MPIVHLKKIDAAARQAMFRFGGPVAVTLHFAQRRHNRICPPGLTCPLLRTP